MEFLMDFVNAFDMGDYARATSFSTQVASFADTLASSQPAFSQELFDRLGNSHVRVGNFDMAITMHRRSLQLAQQIGDREKMCIAYGNLGIAHTSKGDSASAIRLHEESLKLAQELQDPHLMGSAQGNIGNACQLQGRYSEAQDAHSKHLQIALQLGDVHAQARALGNLANTYQSLGQFNDALQMYDKRLQLAVDLCDEHGQSKAYNGKGIAYYSLGESAKAIDMHNKNLKLTTKLGDISGQCDTYCNLGTIYESVGRDILAMKMYEKSLALSERSGDVAARGRAYGNLGNIQQSLGNHDLAQNEHKKALRCAIDTGDVAAQARAYGGIGYALSAMQRFEEAVQMHREDLSASEKTGDKAAQAAASINLAIVYRLLRDYESAVTILNRAAALADETKGRLTMLQSKFNLGLVHLEAGRPEAAEKHLREALEHCERVQEGLRERDEDRVSLSDLHRECYIWMQQVLLQLGRIGDALAVAERGKARALQEVQRRRRLDGNAPAAAVMKAAGDRDSTAEEAQGVTWEKVAQMAASERATLVEYSLIKDDTLVVWVARPGPSAAGELGVTLPETREIHLSAELQSAVGLSLSAALEVLRCAVGVKDRARTVHDGCRSGGGDDEFDDSEDGLLADASAQATARAVEELDDRLLALALWESEANTAAHGSSSTGGSSSGERADGDGGMKRKVGEAGDGRNSGAEGLSDVPDVSGVAGVCSDEDFLVQSAAAVQQHLEVCAWLDREFLLPAAELPQRAGADSVMPAVRVDGGTAKSCGNRSGGLDESDIVCGTGVGSRESMLLDDAELREAAKALKRRVLGWDKLRRAANDDFLQNECAVVNASVRKEIKKRVKALFDHDRLLRLFYKILFQPVQDILSRPQGEVSTMQVEEATKRLGTNASFFALQGADDLLIVPDLELFTVPWAALIDSDGHFLIERYSIRLTPSLLVARQAAASTFTSAPSAAPRSKSARASNANFLVVGNPWPLAQQPVMFGSLLSAKDEALYVADELRNISPSVLSLTHQKATRRAVLDGLDGVSWAHLACHGWLERRALLLCPSAHEQAADSECPSSNEDGLLTAAEMQNIRLQPGSSVVLSACNSGLGRVRSDGVVGIARAFIGAGAGAAIVTLWSVPDKSTLLLMKPFYWAICQGYASPQALRFAMTMMLLRGIGYSEPRSWAGFIVVGASTSLLRDGCDSRQGAFAEWTVQDVQEWLGTENLDDMRSSFEENQVDGAMLQEFASMDDNNVMNMLKNVLGITRLLSRKKFCDSFRLLSAASSNILASAQPACGIMYDFAAMETGFVQAGGDSWLQEVEVCAGDPPRNWIQSTHLSSLAGAAEKEALRALGFDLTLNGKEFSEGNGISQGYLQPHALHKLGVNGYMDLWAPEGPVLKHAKQRVAEGNVMAVSRAVAELEKVVLCRTKDRTTKGCKILCALSKAVKEAVVSQIPLSSPEAYETEIQDTAEGFLLVRLRLEVSLKPGEAGERDVAAAADRISNGDAGLELLAGLKAAISDIDDRRHGTARTFSALESDMTAALASLRLIPLPDPPPPPATAPAGCGIGALSPRDPAESFGGPAAGPDGGMAAVWSGMEAVLHIGGSMDHSEKLFRCLKRRVRKSGRNHEAQLHAMRGCLAAVRRVLADCSG